MVEQEPVVFNVCGMLPQINGDMGSDVSVYSKYCILNFTLGCSLYLSYLSHKPEKVIEN